MATAREIIALAFREANYKNIKGVLSADELSEGLTLLTALQNSFFGMVLGTRLKPWPVPYPMRASSYVSNFPAGSGGEQVLSDDQVTNPPENARVMVHTADPVTIYLPAMPADGSLFSYADVGHRGDVTLNANGAFFNLSGISETVDIGAIYPERNLPRTWVFRADYASWLEVTTPELDEDLPFPADFDDYFITLMAIRLTPRYGNEPRQATLMRYQNMVAFIRGRWRQTEVSIGKDMGIPTAQAYDWDGFGEVSGGGFE